MWTAPKQNLHLGWTFVRLDCVGIYLNFRDKCHWVGIVIAVCIDTTRTTGVYYGNSNHRWIIVKCRWD